MAPSNNDCGRVRRPHRHERTMFAVATNPHATVVARGGRAAAARASKGARPSASHPSDPFPRARFFALFETVRRSSDASARARRYIRAVPLADRALPLPDPISSQQRPRARPRRRARRRRPPARRWPPRSAAGHLPVARNDLRMPRGFAHPPQTRPSSSRATWPPRRRMPPHPPDSCGRARRSSPRSSPSPWGWW